MLTFLPQSHPQSYLPMLFRLWESVNSYIFDERLLHFLAQLAEMHVDPAISDPKYIDEIPDDARSENEGRPNWKRPISVAAASGRNFQGRRHIYRLRLAFHHVQVLGVHGLVVSLNST
jgi:hypothetical protein